MTQDLKDLCLIDKYALAGAYALLAAHNLLSHETDFIEKAHAQDLSGMRLVPESLLTPNQLAWVNAYAPGLETEEK
ncbi:MAG: hypothetical protein INF44_02590 [Thalassospira sp.]|jgi:hypothetical protein|nr:hypothetical protein [Thalassospira sp.]